jgi:hypothetical protein
MSSTSQRLGERAKLVLVHSVRVVDPIEVARLPQEDVDRVIDEFCEARRFGFRKHSHWETILARVYFSSKGVVQAMTRYQVFGDLGY